MKKYMDYRHLIMATVRHEFQVQYKKSILGPLWVIMNPFYMCIIYTVIFSSIIKTGSSKFSYTLYVATGLLTWGFFIDILNRSQMIYLNYAHMIKQQNFPLICLPIVVLSMATIDFVFSFGLFTGYLIATHAFPGWSYIALFPILLMQAIYALGLGSLLGLLNLFFRDIGKSTVILLQAWFWLTPIVYLSETLPAHLRYWLILNPLAAMMDAYHAIIVYHEWPLWRSLWFSLGITLLFSILVLKFYRKHMTDLLDEF